MLLNGKFLNDVNNSVTTKLSCMHKHDFFARDQMIKPRGIESWAFLEARLAKVEGEFSEI